MTIKLVQKRFLNGSREFEIIDNSVYVRMKGLLKEEKLTVGLSMLNPEPVVNGLKLEFYGRARREPLLSLLLNKPNPKEFNTFVDTLKQRVKEEQGSLNAYSELPEAPGWNVYDEPPEFDEPDEVQKKKSYQPVNPERVGEDITMLKTYLDEQDIKQLIDALEILMAEPQNEVAFQAVLDAYNELGINQGAVLTYAPYLKVILSQSIL